MTYDTYRVDSPAYRSYNFIASDDGAVAQLGERVNGIHEVRGSIPLGSTGFLLFGWCCNVLNIFILSGRYYELLGVYPLQSDR